MPLPSPKSVTPRSATLTEGLSACPVCANADVEVYSDDNSDRGLLSSDLGSSRTRVSHGKILRCRACGFGFRAWRPSEEELASLYRELDPEVYEQESSGRFQTAKRHVEIVRNDMAGGRLLDVGCASGSFLSLASEEGWQVVGVEPSSVLCAKARQRLGDRGTVHCSALQNAEIAKDSMDVVTLWDVLEHVPDPLGFLQLCASLVRPGGYVLANVPDLESWQASLLRERWPLLLGEHLNYFSRASLTLAGEASNLRSIRFGRRPASFSLGYVLYRLAQHHFPGAATGHSLVRGRALGSVSIPVYLGESYVVWRRIDKS
jgi:SAM-dependent methyltransferase